MKLTTLCYCLRGDEVLLAMKKRGFGAGKWNGYGGKVQDGETPRVAAVRELHEESGLVVDDVALQHVGIVKFSFDGVVLFECHIFLAREWSGDLKETEEMRPQWFPIAKVPFDEMWVADRKWVPLVLAGKTLEAGVNFNADGSELKEFSYHERDFSPN